MVFHYGIGLGLAVLLNRPMRGRGLYRVLLILPWAVPAFVSAFAWRFMFNQKFGLFNGAARRRSGSTRWRGSTTSGRRCSPPS